MRILMLGWEFPPFIAGGLGVACYGLTKALDKLGHEVIFILPKPVDRSHASHVRMLSPAAAFGTSSGGMPPDSLLLDDEGNPLTGFKHASFHGVDASFSSPYPAFDENAFARTLAGATQELAARREEAIAAGGEPGGVAISDAPAPSPAPHAPTPGHIGMGGGAGVGYGTDLVGDAERYARLVVALTRRETFDLIHAHDWLTFPAGIALAKATGRPLVVHVHSTEFDRAGNNVNQRVYEIERAGMHAADRVIAVSQFTKSLCVRRYGVSPDKVDVVYNGVEREHVQPREGAKIEAKDKIVLFLGRITMQKGPEYFIAAARRVLEKYQDVKFVLAGSGDMALRMIELAASMGIGHKVLFTGFLRGKDIQRVFALADLYVMPSVSEPFGIAPLEALGHDVPILISKTSGVSEVLTHALKVDFWDVDDMANKIVAVLRHPPLSRTLLHHGHFEIRRLTWDGAAERCEQIYRDAVAALR